MTKFRFLQRAIFIVVFVSITIGCVPSTTPKEGTDEPPNSQTTPPAATTAPISETLDSPDIAFEFSNRSELDRVQLEPIKQNNCTGTETATTTTQRTFSIERTLEVGGGFEVNAQGEVGILGTGVSLGSAVAAELGRSYGETEQISQSVEVSAPAGTNMEHTLEFAEVWRVGEAAVVLNNQTVAVPFRFRDDFQLNLQDSSNLGCPTSPSASPTETPVATSIPTPTLSTDGGESQLFIQETNLSGDEFVHLVAGDGFAEVEVGDDLVVYANTGTGVEVPVALIRVIGINPDSLSAQTILFDPENEIRANLRVDDQSDQLSEAALEPVPLIPAVAYFLREGRILILGDAELEAGMTLRALTLETRGAQIIDALPDSSVLLRVTSIGRLGTIASVELEEGILPEPGTFLEITSRPTPPTDTPTPTSTPAPTSTPTPTPSACTATVISTTAATRVGLRESPLGGATSRSVPVGETVQIVNIYDNGSAYEVAYDGSNRVLRGWLPANNLELFSSCEN